MCQTIHSVPRFHAALFRPCRRRWAILLSLDTKLFGEPQRQQLPTACPAPPINLHNFFTRIHAADTHSRARRAPALTCLQHAQGSFALYAPLRSYSSTHVPADALTCSPRSCTHVPAARTGLSCPVRSCALTAALTCLLHAQGSLALYAPLRSYSCTHVPAARTRLSCPVRSLALFRARTALTRSVRSPAPYTLAAHSADSPCTFSAFVCSSC